MEGGQESAAVTAGVGATVAVTVVTLPSTGVGPLASISLLANTFTISVMLVIAAVFMVIAIRMLMLARARR